MSDKGETIKPYPSAVSKNVPRRTFLNRLTGAAAVIATSVGVSIRERGNRKPAEAAPSPAIPTVEDPGPSTTETAEKVRLNKLNQILEQKLNNPKRKLKEQEYTAGVKTLADIDLGLEVCADREVRAALLEKRWKLRTEEKFELKQLPEQHKSWARDNKIYPEVVAICLDNYNLWLDTMRQYQEKGIYSSSVDYSDIIISPYGMARMAQTESAGFVNIGKHPAEGEIDPDVFSQEYSSFVDLIQSMNAGSQLKRFLNNIPGSENPQSEESSGGALGPMQLMASSALGISRELKENFGPDVPITNPNPFSIKWSLLASSILLAEKGYNATDKQKMEKSLLSWNNDRRQAEAVLKADTEYRRMYLKK